MKIKKDNGASLAGFVITILVILLIVSVAVCVYLYKNPVNKQTIVTVTEESSLRDIVESKDIISVTNEIVNNSLVKINDDQNWNSEGRIFDYLEGAGENRISYVVIGNSKGKLEIIKNNEVVQTKLLEKTVISINILCNECFLLFEDGTVGKIDSIDIDNNKLNIQNVIEATNIVRIQEVVFYSDEYLGVDIILCGINNKGEAIELYCYSD